MASLLDYLNPEESEQRFGMKSPTFVIGIIAAYLLFVYKIGPAIMKNRSPYRLKTLMNIYNVIQVVCCLYLINGIWRLTSWDLFNFKICRCYEPNTPERKTFEHLTYFTFWLKVVELLDTIIFVLRKKDNQITYLHVFHHSSTITLGYVLLKYYRGIGAFYPIYLNSWVHVIMYSYYFCANNFSAEVMKKFIMIKKSITIIQMIQFCFILLQAASMWINCQIPLAIIIYYCFVVSVIFYGFYDFYKKAYTNAQTKKSNKNIN
ncbi:very long chain fatty acid elongase 1 [Cochliomyia hominivorax]